MKRSLLNVGVVAATLLVATTASAAGLNFAWQTCAADGGLSSRSFACGVNTGTNLMVGTVIQTTDHIDVSGAEIIIDLISQTTPLPDWWLLKEVGTCRPTSLSMANMADGAACFDWSAAQSTPAVAQYQINPALPGVGPNTARIKCITAVPISALALLSANTEYGFFQIGVNNQKSTGAGSCAGCLDNVCIVLNSINITTTGNLDNRFIGTPHAAGSNQITWQGTGADCQAVPTKNTTWGKVKSLYR